ncbi:TPA_asm: hypothetical protein vir335_00107 [Classicovirus victor]|uniref:Uncharacterized protein n=1 Tax=Caudoviricetes sp. vir335 TaxID=3068357 RepID=A0AA87CI23_9CAUD|nr:TPA_asm: hypothetical protein vir335_00107 [Caudoviricetes sp. vir335]
MSNKSRRKLYEKLQEDGWMPVTMELTDGRVFMCIELRDEQEEMMCELEHAIENDGVFFMHLLPCAFKDAGKAEIAVPAKDVVALTVEDWE